MAVPGSGTRGGRRTGRPPTLSVDDIVAAALEENLAELTMPAVAKRLGVSHSALYRYFQDREALQRACSDHVVRNSPWPDADQPWRALLQSFSAALWASFERHPGLAQVALAVPGTPPAVIAVIERVVESLCSQGFSPHDALLAVDFVSEVTMTQFVTMSALDDAVSHVDTRSGREAYQQSWGSSDVIAQGIDDASTWTGTGWLQDKLALILDGLERRRSV